MNIVCITTKFAQVRHIGSIHMVVFRRTQANFYLSLVDNELVKNVFVFLSCESALLKGKRIKINIIDQDLTKPLNIMCAFVYTSFRC